MSICKQTYYNNGSYLRARSNEKAICELISAIENGTVIPSIVNGGTFLDSITINGDLVVNGSISYQTNLIDSITVPTIYTNTITFCDNYVISCGETGLDVNTAITVTDITADTGTITTLNSTTLAATSLTVTNTMDTLGITTLTSSNATISDVSATNVDVTGTLSINGFPLNKMYSGTIDVGGSSGPFTITFPTAYSTPPLVFLTSFGALRQYYVHYITTTTATISEGAGSGIATSIYWLSTEANS